MRPDQIAENLLEKDYHVADLFPRQVPPERRDAFAAAEQYYLDGSRIHELHEKFFHILVKLGCYYAMQASADNGSTWTTDPEPAWFLEQFSRKGFRLLVLINQDQALVSAQDEDTCMAVYGADDALIDLLKTLCAAEGLYFWKPEHID